MSVPIDKKECCGCSFCVEVCPVHCISMTTDAEGFRYPQIDEAACIHCEKCSKTCSFAAKQNVQSTVKECIVSQHSIMAELMKSRSGAAFAICSDWILSEGGVVYGAVLTPQMEVVHVRATNKESRDLMRGSKYAQSNIEGLFADILQDAKEKPVLFSGTACQVDAVNAYFKIKHGKIDNLYTLDIICHGVPSPMMFREYITYLEKKEKKKVTAFDFRNKKFGWDNHIETYCFGDEEQKSTLYRKLFYEEIALRPSCHNCHYTSLDRVADLTVADAWNIQKVYPEFDYKKGVSLCTANTEKGIRMMERIKAESTWKTAKIEDFMQPNMQHPTAPGKDRDAFWSDYQRKGFEYVLNKYAKKRIWVRIANAARYYSAKLLKK